MVEAHAVKLLLLERLFRSAAGALCFGGKCMCMCPRAVPPPALPTRRLNPYPAEFRRSIISLTDLDKNEGSIAIRNRLKVSYPLEPSGKGLRESLREAVVVAVAKVGADGEFQRYSRIRSVIPKKK